MPDTYSLLMNDISCTKSGVVWQTLLTFLTYRYTKIEIIRYDGMFRLPGPLACLFGLDRKGTPVV